jgi:imidazolonepropionase-like amidohydrolase
MAGLRLRRLLAAEGVGGPGIVAVGQAIFKKGDYGSFLGPGCSSRKEILAFLHRLAAAGVDQGKILLSGIVCFQDYGRVGSSSWTLEEAKTVVQEGHRLGLRMMAHASSAEAVALALQAGVDSIEHGYFITGEQLREMGSRKIAWIPTIIPVAVQVRNPLIRCHPPGRRAIISRIYREQMAKLSLALHEGVPLGLGTDAGASGVRHGESLLEEMLLYSRAGLTNRAILQAATATNACILGINDGRGILEAGREPCLIGVAGNPLSSLEALKKINYFFS